TSCLLLPLTCDHLLLIFIFFFFFLIYRLPPRSTLFPYTTLFRSDLVRLFRARGAERDRVFAAADCLRREINGDTVTYVVTRNVRSEEHTSELQSLAYLVCRLLLEKKKKNTIKQTYEIKTSL